MVISQIEQLNLGIEQASALFDRLVLLAGPSDSGKMSLLRRVSELRNCPFLNVNLKLSQSLLELPRTRRPRQVDRVPGERIV